MIWTFLVVGVAARWRPQGECRPLSDRAWVVGSQHKTGTVLVNMVLQGTTSIVQHVDPIAPNSVRSFDDVPRGAIAVLNHFMMDSVDVYSEILEWATQRELQLRLVFFVRDPLEIILSAFFYHRTTLEPWAKVTPMKELPAFVIGGPIFTNCTDANELEVTIACTVGAYVHENATYQHMMTTVDPEVGIMIEAVGSLWEVEHLYKSSSILRQFPDTARIYDLGNVTSSSEAYDATFTDFFSFLGVVDVPACVHVASRWDANHKDVNPAHAMPSELTAQRNTLRDFLLHHPWFLQRVQPIRLAMGYLS